MKKNDYEEVSNLISSDTRYGSYDVSGYSESESRHLRKMFSDIDSLNMRKYERYDLTAYEMDAIENMNISATHEMDLFKMIYDAYKYGLSKGIRIGKRG